MSDASTPFDIAQMRAAAGAATAMLRGIANEDRLLLLCQMAQGEIAVSALEQRLAGVR